MNSARISTVRQKIPKEQAIRNRINKFDQNSLLNLFISALHQSNLQPTSDFLQLPHVYNLAIEWTLGSKSYSGRQAASRRDAAEILELIWLYQSAAVRINDIGPLNLKLRALFIPQLIYQSDLKSFYYNHIRFKRVIDADDYNGEVFRKSFLQLTDVDIDIFFEISFSICVYSMKSGRRGLKFSDLIMRLTPEYALKDIAKTIRFVSKSVDELRELVTKDHPNAYFKESLLFEYPLILLEDKVVNTHVITILKAISEIFIRRVARREQTLNSSFTKCFERYVSRLHEELSFQVLNEREILDVYVNNKIPNGNKVSDFLIKDGDCSVFVDAKGVEPRNNVLYGIKKYHITKKIEKHHVYAVKQIIETIDALQNCHFSELKPIESRFGIVVTALDFYLGTGESFFTKIEEKTRHDLEERAKGKIFIENLHFLSLGQYEQLLTFVKNTGTTIHEYLSYVSRQEKDDATRCMIYEQYISFYAKRFGKDVRLPNGSPSTIEQFNGIFSRSVQT